MTRALPQPDFLRPVRRGGRLAWAWCITGLLVLAAAGLEAAEAWQQRQHILQRLALAERPTPPAARAPMRPADPAGDAATRALDTQATRWLQRLALPWPGVFAAAESVAVDGVQFTGLAFDGQGPLPQLHLEGQAAQAGPALAAAEALRAAGAGDGSAAGSPQAWQGWPVPQAWQDVTLARLDSAADGRRFEIVARLAVPGTR